MNHYQVHLLKDPGRPGILALLSHLRDLLLPALPREDLFGIFQGLFGLASNELYLVTGTDAHEALIEQVLAETGFEIVTRHEMVPTVRPQGKHTCTRDGIYVFRWFDVMGRDIDEIARLSAQAWITFEGDFETGVQGLFAEPDRERGKMLLVTWYRDLSVWQASRQPPPEARENFLRRHQLTLQAFPVATRLLNLDPNT